MKSLDFPRDSLDFLGNPSFIIYMVLVIAILALWLFVFICKRNKDYIILSTLFGPVMGIYIYI